MLRFPYVSSDQKEDEKPRLSGARAGVGLGSLQVKAGADGREIFHGDMLSNDLEQHLYELDLPSHYLMDDQGVFKLRLINRAQNSLLPIDGIRLIGPDAKDFSLSYGGVSQLGSSEELYLEVAYRPRGSRNGLRQALLRIGDKRPSKSKF